jgi:hypothetical protein
MNKVIRLLTMSGMGLLAGVAFAASPAQAVDSSTGSSAKPSTTKSTEAKPGFGRDYVVGYYRSPRACELAGRIGERFGKWDDYDCDFVRFGPRRGLFALEVERNFFGGGWGRPGHHNGPWGHHGPRGPRF